MKVIIAGGGTGGHLFPAVALGAELMRQRPSTEVLFVGTSAGFEARWLPASGLRFELFKVHGLRGHSARERMMAMPEFARAIAQAIGVLRRFPAAVVVSAGGYASVPMAVAAIIKRVPLILMEQNTRPGLANRSLWHFAKKVCVGFEDTAAFFSTNKVTVTGNPIRNEFGRLREAGKEPFQSQILVLGGSTGAHRLNLGVVNAVEKLTKDVIKWSLIHQTGEADAGIVKAAYGKLGWPGVTVVPFIDDISAALMDATLVVARSGAVTVSEIALVGRPAIFVPYPFHRDRQQEHNARVIERAGGALVIRDDEHLAENLTRAIPELMADSTRLARMARAAKSVGRPDAAARIAEICFQAADAGARA
ncbi:MAG: undecaprenyldiphospho-muramoylpentapeptide beta-N-acetylglucosaminyltransferase [Candidatus Binataceae bacterium]|nr:undecaprenyldiphospho-muramoylpentapeptide beta-N-acetylglucosaminyltransferase [Candidatus Binataceae bacterium]